MHDVPTCDSRLNISLSSEMHGFALRFTALHTDSGREVPSSFMTYYKGPKSVKFLNDNDEEGNNKKWPQTDKE